MDIPQKSKTIREFGLSSFSVDNSTSVIILTLIITVLGLGAYRTMPKESFPEIVIPTVYVGTPYPGNSPVDMENLITRPIEKQLKSLNNVKDIKSTSVQDFSSIVVEFTPGVELAKAIQDVKDAVDKSKSELPTDLDQEPNVQEVNTSDFPIMNVNISGPYSEEELKRYGEYLEDAIEKLPENLSVVGDLKLTSCRHLTTLPDNLSVSGSLMLNGSTITTLPKNLVVGGELDVSRTPIINNLHHEVAIPGRSNTIIFNSIHDIFKQKLKQNKCTVNGNIYFI